jgi:hypothetical protein
MRKWRKVEEIRSVLANSSPSIYNEHTNFFPEEPDMNEKREALKQIIKDLHTGAAVKDLRKRFAALIKDTSPEEIADMENSLIQDGFPPEEIQRLCEVHAEVFDKSLKKAGKPSKVPGHPVYTYVEENREARRRLKDLKRALRKFKRDAPDASDMKHFTDLFADFREIEKHYARKENQLFPVLEAKGFTGPTKVMWGKHDEIRAHLRNVGDRFAAHDWGGLSDRFQALAAAVKKMIFLEEKILFPTSARKLGVADWARIKNGEPAIGYAWVKPSDLWDAKLAKTMDTPVTAPSPGVISSAPSGAALTGEASATVQDTSATGSILLSEGRLSPEQIDLMLRHLPLDVTFVDENDRVLYYSEGKERIFPRSPAIIGRDVQNCHPPKSLHVVNEIVRAFKEGTKEVAEFWIQRQDGPVVHIRYFAVRDAEGKYRGVIEVTQEISHLRTLTGERRLLDW